MRVYSTIPLGPLPSTHEDIGTARLSIQPSLPQRFNSPEISKGVVDIRKSLPGKLPPVRAEYALFGALRLMLHTLDR
jgi:hypothetical protein